MTMKTKLTRMKDLGPQGLGDHEAYILKRLHEFNIGCSKCGEFAYIFDDTTDSKRVDGGSLKENELKSLLRRDYLEHFSHPQKLSGKALTNLIELMLRRAKRAAANVISNHKYEGLTVMAKIA